MFNIPIIALLLFLLAPTFSWALPMGDVNGNGKVDFVTNDGSKVRVAYDPPSTTSTLTVTEYNAPPSTVASTDRTIVMADINADGKDDIIFHRTNGNLTAWRTTGLDQNVLTFADFDSPWYIAAWGKVNGDSFEDLVMHNPSTGKIRVLFMASTGVGSNVEIADSASDPWRIATFGDVNKDGTIDLIWYNTSTGSTVVWFLGTDGEKDSDNGITSVDPSSGWRWEGTGDLDGDGVPDLLWHYGNDSYGNFCVYWLDTNGDVDESACPTNANPSRFYVAGTGDVDGDGRDEVIWRDLDSTGSHKGDFPTHHYSSGRSFESGEIRGKRDINERVAPIDNDTSGNPLF